ncbi:hypothetical protein V6N13_121218 [Hibiscus sabdariffa]|uniref:Uncharacterized protein n=2 Tax=Hibiscus sabdariffa TaxID=183260 RepID=A0ABR2PF50_9ROSI
MTRFEAHGGGLLLLVWHPSIHHDCHVHDPPSPPPPVGSANYKVALAVHTTQFCSLHVAFNCLSRLDLAAGFLKPNNVPKSSLLELLLL